MRDGLKVIGVIVLIGAAFSAILTFNEWVKGHGDLTYAAATLGIAALLLACGGMLLLGLAAILQELQWIREDLQPVDVD